jgi:long-subunit fatty acid transport protein
MPSLAATLWAVAGAMSSPLAAQELPLTVEDILTARDRVRVDVDIAYFNSTRESQALAVRENTDALNLTAGVRYGWTLDTELAFDASYGYEDRRYQYGDARASSSEEGLRAISLGISHRLLPDGETPALIVFASVAQERNRAWNGHRYGGSVGITTYRSLDPVLLALSLSYRDCQGHRQGDIDIQDGKSFSLAPSISFAANNWVTLIGGIDWRWREGSRADDSRIEINRTTTRVRLGVGYHWSPDLSISAMANFTVSESGGSGINIGLIYKFDTPI